MENLSSLFLKNTIAPYVGKSAKYFSMLVKNSFLQHNIALTKEQFIVLACVEEESQPQSSLANITERDKGSLARLVQSLEKKKYVVRKACCEDNRVNWVQITEKGKSILKKRNPLC